MGQAPCAVSWARAYERVRGHLWLQFFSIQVCTYEETSPMNQYILKNEKEKQVAALNKMNNLIIN